MSSPRRWTNTTSNCAPTRARRSSSKLANPVYHIHNGDVPESTMVVPFAMLLNLVSVSGAEEKEKLWGFIRRYAPEASPEGEPRSGPGRRLRHPLLQRFREADARLPRGHRAGSRGDARAVRTALAMRTRRWT